MAVTGDDVDERGLHFPTKPTQVLKLLRCPDHRAAALCGMFSFSLVPANPGHF